MKDNKQAGFTLIELTVVLLVLVALAGVAMPYVSGISQKSLCQATDVTMQNIKKVIMDRYYLDTLGNFPADKGATDYNLKYLFIQENWQSFDIDSQTGWRGAYLQNGVEISTPPNDSFKQTNNKVHTDITGMQVLDAWGRPIVIQLYCSNSSYTTKADCITNNASWIARLVSAGQGIGFDSAEIETSITGNRIGDDRVLYLNAPTPANDINISCEY